jgi:hypothetical protein
MPLPLSFKFVYACVWVHPSSQPSMHRIHPSIIDDPSMMDGYIYIYIYMIDGWMAIAGWMAG